MRAFLGETHFLYMYSTLFLNLHLTIPFNKFEVYVLHELNFAPIHLNLNAWTSMCTFRVLRNEFFMTLTTSKFLHHYNVKENKKGGWVSLIGIRAVIGPFTTYKNFKGNFFRVRPGVESMLIYFTRQGATHFPFYWTPSPNNDIVKLVMYMSPSNKEDMIVLCKFPRALHCKTLVDMPFRKTLTANWDHEYFYFLLFCFCFLC